MTIEERKERILEITRTIINHELSITQLKDEMDDLISLMDGRKRRAIKPKATPKQQEEKPEPFVPELPTEPSDL